MEEWQEIEADLDLTISKQTTKTVTIAPIKKHTLFAQHLIKNPLNILFFMYMRVFYMYVYVPSMCVRGAYGGHETADPWAWPYSLGSAGN